MKTSRNAFQKGVANEYYKVQLMLFNLFIYLGILSDHSY